MWCCLAYYPAQLDVQTELTDLIESISAGACVPSGLPPFGGGEQLTVPSELTLHLYLVK